MSEETIVAEEHGIIQRLSDAPHLEDCQMGRNDELSSDMSLDRADISSYRFSTLTSRWGSTPPFAVAAAIERAHALQSLLHIEYSIVN